MEKKMETVAVVMPVRNEEASLPSLLKGIFASVPSGYEVQVVLAVNNSSSEFERWVDNLAKKNDRIYALQLGQLHPHTFALAYLRGLEFAIHDLQADYIVEMDGNGSHDPRALRLFMESLKRDKTEAVLSTRFSHGGGIVGYPLQRRLASLIGTILANLILGLGRPVPDMSSGYEAFRAETLCKVFSAVPIDEWVSVKQGPGHFYQIEMRAYLCWMGCRISFVPIIWGTGRIESPTKLPPGDLIRAFKSLLLLRKKREKFIECLRSQV